MYDEEFNSGGSMFMGTLTVIMIVAIVFYLKSPNKTDKTNESSSSNDKSTEWTKVCEEQTVTSEFIKGDGGTSFNRNLSVVNNDYYLQMEDGSIWIVDKKQDWGKVIVGKKDKNICNMEIKISNEFN